MIPGTLRELFLHNDWARDRLLQAAAACSDADLDRPFEMGEGSLRRTLNHLWGGEEFWLQRWTGLPVTVRDDEVMSVDELADRFRATATAREKWLETRDEESLSKTFRYARPFWMDPGPDMELNLGVSVLHILNHGPHHRAQAINMLKHLGATPPALVMRLDGESPRLDLATLRRYLRHGDWAYRQVHEAASTLSDAARNREFPIGPGTLRRIIRHLAHAPAWWMDNIEQVRIEPFPAIDETDPWDALWVRYAEAARRREGFLDGLQDADLDRRVRITPRPGLERSFPIGVAMLQLCVHGTHHRAQAVNMLRHLGAKVPSLDVAVWERQGAPALV